MNTTAADRNQETRERARSAMREAYLEEAIRQAAAERQARDQPAS
jgi:hypothetical protein